MQLFEHEFSLQGSFHCKSASSVEPNCPFGSTDEAEFLIGRGALMGLCLKCRVFKDLLIRTLPVAHIPYQKAAHLSCYCSSCASSAYPPPRLQHNPINPAHPLRHGVSPTTRRNLEGESLYRKRKKVRKIMHFFASPN